MTNSKLWLLLLQVIHAFIEMYKSYSQKSRTDAVRADPGSEWLRKFGGTDKRAGTDASSSEDTRGGSNG